MRKLLISFTTALSLLPTGSFAQKSDFCKIETQNRITELLLKNQNNIGTPNIISEKLLSTFQDDKYGVNENIINNSLEEKNLNESPEEKWWRLIILLVYILSMYCFGFGYPLKIEHDEIKDHIKKMKLDSNKDLKRQLKELKKTYNGKDTIEDLFNKFSKSLTFNYMLRFKNKPNTSTPDNNEKDHMSPIDLHIDEIRKVFEISFNKVFSYYCEKRTKKAKRLKDSLFKIFIKYLKDNEEELNKTLFFKRCLC